MIDPVNHPPHYAFGNHEPINVIEDWGLGFCLGNVVKYIARAGLKGHQIEDLEKALWYLSREIDRLKKARAERAEVIRKLRNGVAEGEQGEAE